MKYWSCNYHHACRKFNMFSLNSDLLYLGIRKTCVVINNLLHYFLSILLGNG